LVKQADFEIVAEASDGEAAVSLAQELAPNVVIMDIGMPKLNGLEATRRIKAKCPTVAVLVLTVHDDSEHILGILEAGADGYLTKSVFGEEVIQAIRSVVAGETVLSAQVLQKILKHVLRYPTKPLKLETGEKLTIRQLEILRLAAKGMSNRDMALALNLSLRTVKGYMVEIFAKLKVNSRTEAVITALRVGILTINDLE
jgi:DNA-binding NarL/FixJ family response regulator